MKGIFNFKLESREVQVYTEDKELLEFDDLDSFIYNKDKGQYFTTMDELVAIYYYLQESIRPEFNVKWMYINQEINKKIGLRIYKHKTHSFKTFYDMKYKIGSDELNRDKAADLIKNTNFKSCNEGYTSKLKKQLVLEDSRIKVTIISPPSMSPVIYSSPIIEYRNVQCFDITSAYPYLLTQPLPHFDKWVNFESEKQFKENDTTFYGGLKIHNIKAKKPYYPLTLVGKNDLGITVESQGININYRGKQIISADEVTLYGFVPDLLEILNRNYYFDSYEISKKLVRFNLKIDQGLRKKVLECFEAKQTKKRNNEDYTGEKILLNRFYGFFITKGSKAPAHYGQYVVSQQRLIMDRMIHKIGLKDMVHAHTDSVKFIGNHAAAIEEYNNTIEFSELGRFVLEDVFQKCVYYSHITAKYINSKGELKFKHGGIAEYGLQHLYRMRYEDINDSTEFFLTRTYAYNENGYEALGTKTSFRKGVNPQEDE